MMGDIERITESPLFQLALWIGGIFVGLIGWFANDRVTAMDKRISKLEEDMKTMDKETAKRADVAAIREDLATAKDEIREDIRALVRRVDKSYDRRSTSHETE